MQSPRSPLLMAMAATTLAGVLLAALGPFGTYLNGSFLSRLPYWLATSWLGLPLYGGIGRIVARRGWIALLGGSLLASVPEAWASHALACRIWPMLSDHGPSPALWYAQTALIGALWTLVLARILPVTAPQPLAVKPAATDVFGGQVLALQMEDHYVRIHRREGSQMVLMPLTQAIAALGAAEGLRTHRSWWVARAAVAEISGTPRAMKLILHNGLEAPVARSAVTHLRQAGWLQD